MVVPLNLASADILNADVWLNHLVEPNLATRFDIKRAVGHDDFNVARAANIAISINAYVEAHHIATQLVHDRVVEVKQIHLEVAIDDALLDDIIILLLDNHAAITLPLESYPLHTYLAYCWGRQSPSSQPPWYSNPCRYDRQT